MKLSARWSGRLSNRLALASLSMLVAAGASVPAHAGLRESIDAVLKDKLLAKATVGIKVVRLGQTAGEKPQVVYEHNDRTPLIPASNLKIIATSTALHHLGADFKFRTLLAIRGNGNGVDVAIIGDGDPTFGDAELLKKVGWGTTTVFDNWLQLLKQRGLTEIGNVFVDDSVFDQSFLHPNWPADQETRRYVAQVGGFNLNANCLDFYLRLGAQQGQPVTYITDPPTKYASVKNKCETGRNNYVTFVRPRGTNDITLGGEANGNNTAPISVTIHDPGLFAATTFSEVLATGGMKLRGGVSRDATIRSTITKADASQPADQKWTVVAIQETPLTTVLARANKDSMNLYAEALCKRVGFAATGESGSWENGNLAIGRYLTQTVGVPATEFSLDDGCGLSKKNGISANALAQVLRLNYESPYRDIFLASLAVAGVDGTFADRFKGTDLVKRVIGKSGYVSGVSSISGYLKRKDGTWYAFSIILNGVPEGMNGDAKLLQEKIIRAVDSQTEVASGQE